MINAILIILCLAGGTDIKENVFLRDQRQSRINEINSDPVLKENVLKLLHLEINGVRGKTGVMEALINRAVMTQGTIKQELFSGFYGPIKRGRLKKKLNHDGRVSSQSAFNNVASGSNLIKSRTDQGMAGDPNSSGPGRIRVSGTTEIFNYWKGSRRGKDYSHETSRAWSNEQERRIVVAMNNSES